MSNQFSSLNIDGYQYKVEWINQDSGKIATNLYGESNIADLSITVREVSPVHDLDTMIHEIIHTVFGHRFASCDRFTRSDEERITSLIASGLSSLLIANPEFCDWLYSQVEEARKLLSSNKGEPNVSAKRRRSVPKKPRKS